MIETIQPLELDISKTVFENESGNLWRFTGVIRLRTRGGSNLGGVMNAIIKLAERYDATVITVFHGATLEAKPGTTVTDLDDQMLCQRNTA